MQNNRFVTILLYNDTRFYELLVGATAFLFGLGFFTEIFTGSLGAYTVMFKLLPHTGWGVLFCGFGLLGLFGSVSTKDWTRYTATIGQIFLWSLIGVVFWQLRAISTILYFFIALKLGWVMFRLILDKDRPDQTSVIL